MGREQKLPYKKKKRFPNTVVLNKVKTNLALAQTCSVLFSFAILLSFSEMIDGLYVTKRPSLLDETRL